MHLTPGRVALPVPAGKSLSSWTRSLPEADVLVGLATAEPGLAIAEWRTRVDQSLQHASADRRREVMTFLSRDLLDSDGAHLTPSTFLRLAKELPVQGRRELVWGRYLFTLSLVHAAMAEVLAPKALLLDEPLLPEDELVLSTNSWLEWLMSRLKPGASEKSAINTRGNLVAALRSVGCLVTSPGRQGTTRVSRTLPHPLAFAWLIGHEMARTGVREVTDAWACSHSFAARLFLCDSVHAQLCLDAGVAAGLLRRSYLAGEARLLLMEPG